MYHDFHYDKFTSVRFIMPCTTGVQQSYYQRDLYHKVQVLLTVMCATVVELRYMYKYQYGYKQMKLCKLQVGTI